MPPRKYIKKQAKKTVVAVKKRYTTRTGKGVRVNKMVSDIAHIKRMLNVEHKNIDFHFGSNKAVPAQRPTKSVPLIIPLPLPIKGTGYSDRVGNQFKITHITAKYEFLFTNNSDLVQRSSVSAQILFSKSGDDVPDITKLYELDANGHYTPMSFTNSQEFGKYTWMKGLTAIKSHTQPTNRFPLSDVNGNTNIATGGGTQSVQTPAAVSLNNAPYYVNKKIECSIRVMFNNGSDTVVEQMKPYLLLRSDVIDAAVDYDPVLVSGTIRMTYVDN